jgi:hypothetical protein
MQRTLTHHTTRSWHACRGMIALRHARCRTYPQVLDGVSEEAHGPVTLLALLAQLSLEALRVQPCVLLVMGMCVCVCMCAGSW